jgi:hypothetical protein
MDLADRSWILVALAPLAGCITVAPPPPTLPRVAESRLLSVVGERADALGWTVSPVEDGLVRLRMHDGRELVVREDATAVPWLEAGRWVLRRAPTGLEAVEIVSGLDAFLEVRPRGGEPLIVPIAEVMGLLHEAPPEPTPPPPERPRGRVTELVELSETTDVRAGRAMSCADGTVHVLLGSGVELDLPETRVRDLRLVVGQPVTAFWEGTAYPAHVTALRPGEARIAWDDGSDTPEQWVRTSMLDRVLGPTEARRALTACRSAGPVAVELGQRVVVGHILSCEGTTRVVQGPQGILRLVEPAAAGRARLVVGDRVQARWNHQTPYAATVLAIGERIRVRWEDQSETEVDPADVLEYVRTEDRPSEQAECPAAPAS